MRIRERLAALGDSPRRTAAGFAVGVFLSFSPFLGLQIGLGLAAAVAFRLHKVAVLIGLCANLPWIMVPWYVVTTAGAAAVLGLSTAADLDTRLASIAALSVYQGIFWERGLELLRPYLWSFLIGPTAGAAVLGVAAYFISLRLLGSPRDSFPGGATAPIDARSAADSCATPVTGSEAAQRKRPEASA